jgi:hypothetical protein
MYYSIMPEGSCPGACFSLNLSTHSRQCLLSASHALVSLTRVFHCYKQGVFWADQHPELMYGHARPGSSPWLAWEQASGPQTCSGLGSGWAVCSVGATWNGTPCSAQALPGPEPGQSGGDMPRLGAGAVGRPGVPWLSVQALRWATQLAQPDTRARHPAMRARQGVTRPRASSSRV